MTFALLLKEQRKALKTQEQQVKPLRYTIWTLDVWGNEKDGYQINDRYRVGSIEIDRFSTNTQILTLLKRDGWVKSSVNNRYLHIEWVHDDLAFYLTNSKGLWLYQFEAEEELEKQHLKFCIAHQNRLSGAGFGKK